MEKNGIFVVAAFVSPYAETRDFVRKLSKHYIEVYVSTPLQECELRDKDGLYYKAKKKIIQGFEE